MPAFQFTSSDTVEELVKTASAYPSSRVTPVEFVRAVAVRSFSLGLSENDLLVFLKRRTVSHPGLDTFLSNRPAYRRLISSARAAASSSSPAGAEKNSVATARLLLGRILTPLDASVDGLKPLSDARQIRARAAMAIVGVEQIKSIRSEKGWNTVMVSYAWLSLRMGSSQPTAKAALNDLVQLRWLKELTSNRPDSARRFKLAGRLTPDQGQTVRAHFDSIGSLARFNDEPSLTAELVRSITHPAWTYGPEPLSHKAWLTSLALAAAVDPAQLGVGSRYLAKTKRTLAGSGLDLDRLEGDTTLVQVALKEWAQRTGSYDAAQEAKWLNDVRVAARVAERAHIQDVRAQAHEAVERIFGPAQSIPPATAHKDARSQWLQGAAEAMTGSVLEPVQRKATHREIVKRLRGRSYEDALAVRMADLILEDTELALAA